MIKFGPFTLWLHVFVHPWTSFSTAAVDSLLKTANNHKHKHLCQTDLPYQFSPLGQTVAKCRVRHPLKNKTEQKHWSGTGDLLFGQNILNANFAHLRSDSHRHRDLLQTPWKPMVPRDKCWRVLWEEFGNKTKF